MKLIHGIWHKKTLPEKQFVASWRVMNPDAIVKVWTFTEAEALMSLEYPKLIPIYDSMPFLLQRANLLRIVILAACGGIYLDLDMQCLRPFGEFFNADLVLGNTRPAGMPAVVCNAILGAKCNGHHLWNHLLSSMQQCRRILCDTEAVKTTGSLLLTDVVAELGLNHHIRPQKVFFPAACKPNGDAYTRHHVGRPEWTGKQFVDGQLHENKSELVCK